MRAGTREVRTRWFSTTTAKGSIKANEKMKTIKEMAAVWRGVNGDLNTTDRRDRQTNQQRGRNYMMKMVMQIGPTRLKKSDASIKKVESGEMETHLQTIENEG